MKDESWYKSDIVKQARKFGDYARRMEDKYTVGMPDLLYAPETKPTCLIEAKLITGPKFGPTPRQYHEMDRWSTSNHSLRRSLVLGFKDGLYYMVDYEFTNAGVSPQDCLVSDPGEPFPLFIRRFLK